MRRAWLPVCSVLWPVLLVSRLAAASPLQMFGIGGDSPARGGTGCADATGYDGLYLKNTDDRLCAGRDEIHSRMGGSCRIDRFRKLVPVVR